MVGSQHSWKNKFNDGIETVGVIVGVVVLVNVFVGVTVGVVVIVGVGGGQEPLTQGPVIEIITLGSSVDGNLPQTYNVVRPAIVP